MAVSLASVSYVRYIPAAVNNVHTEKEAMGRKKLWEKRITFPLSEDMLDRLDAACAKDETRLDLIRAAVERELKRRERASK